MKKRSFSLVEVVCASLLGVWLMASLMQIYRLCQQTENKTEQISRRVFELGQAHALLNESLGLGGSGTVSPALPASGITFAFDNGIDPDSKLCGTVHGHIWLNKERALMLSIYRIEKDVISAERHQLLLSHVENPVFKLWDGKAWTIGEHLPISSQTRAVQIEMHCRGRPEVLTTHLIYAPPLEV